MMHDDVGASSALILLMDGGGIITPSHHDASDHHIIIMINDADAVFVNGAGAIESHFSFHSPANLPGNLLLSFFFFG
jgi:hypothetical protein